MPETRCLVVGAGTFGLSTAWHLARRGYTDVTVVDRFPPPSRGSAGYDLNKIVRTEYNDDLLGQAACDALQEWRTNPLFSPFYHETGWYLLSKRVANEAHQDEGEKRIVIDAACEASRRRGGEPVYLGDAAAIAGHCPYLEGVAESFYGLYNAEAGWVEAANAIEALAHDAEQLGVKLLHGPSAAMASLLRDTDGKVIGIHTEDGTELFADRIIIAAGSWIESLIDCDGQLTSGGYIVAHIQLSPEETQHYANLPVIDSHGCSDGVGGYTFCPTPDGVLKVGLVTTGRTNYDASGVSRPLTDLRSPISQEDEEHCRSFLRLVLPELADRPFSHTRLCWDAESIDTHWLITPHPSSPETLFLAGGGSGHSFKNLPLLGKYVVDTMEGQVNDAWRWRPNKAPLGLHYIDVKDQQGSPEQKPSESSDPLSSRFSQRGGHRLGGRAAA